EEFLGLDEHNFVALLHKKAKEAPEDKKKGIAEAIEALERLRRREKYWRAITDEKVGITSALASPEEKFRETISELKTITETFQKEFQKQFGVMLRHDIERDIRPIGLKRPEAARFLEQSVVYDIHTGNARSFAEYSPHYKTLTKIVIPIRLFAPYADAKRLWQTAPTELRRFNERLHDEFARWESRKLKQSLP
ncbi:MAG TPA: hypothetical protein VNX21_09035, partial [Candidatus Thermoplasmatota archaeon]|nr:hypothetical protein [Candidatus Thermoplasmatota archaeon]